MSELAGKVALVTGGSRGIGAAITKRLARDGADVALTYHSAADRARGIVTELERTGRRGLAIAADSADPEAVTRAVERAATELGRLDILVNSAGVFPYGQVEDVTPEEYENTMAVHVRAVFVAVQAASRHLGSGGRIISIGSSLAEQTPFPGISLYALSKSALVGLTKGLARDFGERGITANVVHPGATDTDMNPADGAGSDAQRQFIALGHYGNTEDVAATVAHLAGEGGRYITGQAITVDGGWTA